MHALVVEVEITDFEAARKHLLENMPEGVKQTPGFLTGTWTAPVDGRGLSMAVFDTEENARAMAAHMAPGTAINEHVTVVSCEVREVVLHV